jgi:glycosyltransferase involved in cell wall biosynthesis
MPVTPTRDVVVATTSYDALNPLPDLLAGELERTGFDVWRMPLSALRRAARHERRPIVVVLHWIGHLARGSTGHSLLAIAKYSVLLALLRRRRVRIVWYLHNDRSHEVDHPRLERLSQWLTSNVLADRTVVMSHSSVGAARGRRARARTRVVPHPSYERSYPAPPGRSDARRALGLGIGDDTPLLLSFGHVRDYKRVPELVEAFVRTATPDAALLVAGRATEPPIRERLEQLAAADGRVHLRLDVVPHDEVATVMGAADWLVLAHDHVLNSGVALLAVTFGVPVLAPALGSLPEVLRDGDDVAGILYGPGGLDAALAEAMSATPAAREAMVAAARRVRARTSLDAVGAALAAVVTEVAGR